MAHLPLLAELDPASQTRGMLLLACIVGIGLVGIIVIAGLSIARHRHWQRLRREQKHQSEAPPVDPWEEAGRRMAVPDSPEMESETRDGATPS